MRGTEAAEVLLLASALVVALASVLGGATGFATSLLSTPLLLLVGVDLPTVVVVNLVATFVSRIAVVVREWEHLNRRRVLTICAGSAPAAWAGAVLVGRLDPSVLRVSAGSLVALMGLGLLLTHRSGVRRPPSRPAELVTGLFGGFLSTSTSLNGPPVAILLGRARIAPTTFIADLAGYFVVTNAVSLAILTGRGAVPTSLLWPTLPVLIVAAVLGNQLGRRLTGRLSAERFRLVVTLLVIVSGLATALG